MRKGSYCSRIIILMKSYARVSSNYTFDSLKGKTQPFSMKDTDSSAASKLPSKYVENSEDTYKSGIKYKFIRKLLEILACKEMHDIVSWNLNGTSFIIKNIRLFIEEVLPRFYKHNSMSNFIRQLNMYNFKKQKNSSSSSHSPPVLVYHNPLFIKDDYKSISIIDRKAGRYKGCLSDQCEEIKDSSLQLKNKSILHKLDEKIDEQYCYDSSNCPSLSANILKNKLSTLKSKNQVLQEEYTSINRETLEKDAYTLKLEQILLFLSSQVSTLPEYNQLDSVTKLGKTRDKKPYTQQNNDKLNPNSYHKNMLIWSKPLDDCSCTLTNDLSTVIGKVIVKYKQHVSRSYNVKSKFLTDTSFKESNDPPGSQSFIEVSDINPVFRMQLRSNQSSFKTTTSKLNLFEDPISNPYMSFNDSKLCLNSFTTLKQSSFTKASYNDPYFDKDEA